MKKEIGRRKVNELEFMERVRLVGFIEADNVFALYFGRKTNDKTGEELSTFVYGQIGQQRSLSLPTAQIEFDGQNVLPKGSSPNSNSLVGYLDSELKEIGIGVAA